MKKFIFIAVLTASGLVFVSCSTDTAEFENGSSKQKEVLLKESDGVYSRVGDSIPVTSNLQTTVDGPGDGPIVGTPSPRP
jgi:hypothetical protein